MYAATWFQTKVAVKYLTKEGGEAEKEFLNEIKVMAACWGYHFSTLFSDVFQYVRITRGLM